MEFAAGTESAPGALQGSRIRASIPLCLIRGLHDFKMETYVMSDHHLKFKGPGFDFDAKGWLAILAAILIVVLLLLIPRLFY
jgi:hypothetical protein